MPDYEYRCRDCGKRFEIHAPCHLKPEHPSCLHCLSNNTQAMFSAFIVGSRSKSTGATTTAGSCSGCKGGNCSSCH